jgi:hypothetical protein
LIKVSKSALDLTSAALSSELLASKEALNKVSFYKTTSKVSLLNVEAI